MSLEGHWRPCHVLRAMLGGLGSHQLWKRSHITRLSFDTGNYEDSDSEDRFLWVGWLSLKMEIILDHVRQKLSRTPPLGSYKSSEITWVNFISLKNDTFGPLKWARPNPWRMEGKLPTPVMKKATSNDQSVGNSAISFWRWKGSWARGRGRSRGALHLLTWAKPANCWSSWCQVFFWLGRWGRGRWRRWRWEIVHELRFDFRGDICQRIRGDLRTSASKAFKKLDALGEAGRRHGFMFDMKRSLARMHWASRSSRRIGQRPIELGAYSWPVRSYMWVFWDDFTQRFQHLVWMGWSEPESATLRDHLDLPISKVELRSVCTPWAWRIAFLCRLILVPRELWPETQSMFGVCFTFKVVW